MKRALSMMFALLCFVTQGWAEKVTDLAQLSNDKVYVLSSARAFLLYSDVAGISNQLCTSTGKKVGNVTANLEDPKQQFRIEKNGDNYYLFSIGANQYVNKSGNYSSTATDALKLEQVDKAGYPWKLTIGGNGMNTQIKGQTDNGIMVNGWTTTDDGNCFCIEEATPVAKAYEIKVLGTENSSVSVTFDGKQYKAGEKIATEKTVTAADLQVSSVDGMKSYVYVQYPDIIVSYMDNNTKFYTMQNGKGGYVSLNSTYMEGGSMTLKNKEKPRDNKALWAFVSAGDGKYKVYNYSMGLARALGIQGEEAQARAQMTKPEGENTTFAGTFKLGSDEPSYIKIDGTNKWWNDREGFLALWNVGGVEGDNGSKFFIKEVDPTDYPDNYFYEVPNITGVASFTPKNPNTLWYKTSAAATGVQNPWMEYALPLGNGELGCMVYGGVHNEEIQFNEKTLWSGEANKVGAASGSRTFMNFGSVIVENLDNSIMNGVTDYVRYLDIEEGIAGVSFKNGNGSQFSRKYLSSAPDQVIAAQYKAEGTDKMNLVFTLNPGDGIGAKAVKYEDGTASFTGNMTVKYAARLHIVADKDAKVTTTAKGISVSNATEISFYLKGATNFDGDVAASTYFTQETAEQVNARAQEAITAAAAKGYEAIEADHITDFRAITKRMTFDMGLTTPTVDTKTLIDSYYPNNQDANSTKNDHLFLEQLYFHFGRYLAISSNRKPIAAPNNLQGIWNNRGGDSPWNSDIHTNINIQMNYWPTESTNLSDLHKPFVNFILRGANSPGWKQVASNYNNGHGWSVLTETSLYNSMSTWGANYLVANAWYTSHLWTHWRYTQDKEFLQKALPVMWGAAQFWFHRLIEDRGFDSSKDEQQTVKNYKPAYKFDPDGTFVAPDEFSAEQHDNEKEDGTAHAQQMITYLFQNISDAITILGQENTGLSLEDVAKLNDYIKKTDNGLHTEKYNGKWGEPYNGVNKGDLLLREWKYSPFDISGDRGHRHMSHLMALFPMDQITPESEYFTPAVNSLKLRGDAATGWSMGWKVNLWARALDGDHAHIIIKNALKHSTSYGTDAGAGGIYYNLFDSHAPFQIDGNFGVCSGIAECLMQSAHGYINVLPALPSVWNKQGAVKGMKAIGNFTVDFNWADGKCQQIRIQSHAGAPLKLRCNKGAMKLDKASIKVNGVNVSVTLDKDNVATIPCAQNDVVEVDFNQVTSVDSVQQNDQNGKADIYDLSGRRLSEVPAGQVYISNGVKKIGK